MFRCRCPRILGTGAARRSGRAAASSSSPSGWRCDCSSICSGAGVPASWEQDRPGGQAELQQAPPVPQGGGVNVHRYVQVQVSLYPGNRSSQEVRQSRSKLLQSLRVRCDCSPICSGAGVLVSWEQDRPGGQAEPQQAPPVPQGGGVIVHLHVQVQVSPYPGNRSGREVRQSHSKLLQSLRVEV
jgi:hypothetical protein